VSGSEVGKASPRLIYASITIGGFPATSAANLANSVHAANWHFSAPRFRTAYFRRGKNDAGKRRGGGVL
jgi:hypothetical protein